MVTFLYKEPLKLLLRTLNNIKLMEGSSEIIMGIFLEDRTPNKEDIIKEVTTQYNSTFK